MKTRLAVFVSAVIVIFVIVVYNCLQSSSSVQHINHPSPSRTPNLYETVGKDDGIQLDFLMSEGVRYFENLQYDESLKTFVDILRIAPNNKKAREYMLESAQKLLEIKPGLPKEVEKEATPKDSSVKEEIPSEDRAAIEKVYKTYVVARNSQNIPLIQAITTKKYFDSKDWNRLVSYYMNNHDFPDRGLIFFFKGETASAMGTLTVGNLEMHYTTLFLKKVNGNWLVYGNDET